MDQQEFHRLLDLFPVVRSRYYHAESELSRQPTSSSAQDEKLREWQDAWNEGDCKDVNNNNSDQHDAFWKKLKSAVERKVDAATAVRFCKAFQQVHNKVVFEELSLEAAGNFLDLPANGKELSS